MIKKKSVFVAVCAVLLLGFVGCSNPAGGDSKDKDTGSNQTTDTSGTGTSTSEDNKTYSYTVKHYQQPVSGSTLKSNYVLVDSDTEKLTGKASAKTEAKAKTYTGFTSQTFSQKTILSDNSTVVSIYYDRNKHTVTFDTAGGSTINSKQVLYGAAITVSEPTKKGYKFTGWNPELPSVMGDSDIKVTAQWAEIKGNISAIIY